ncbi:phenolic acid decarboxylase subunit B [mine drainage metagenome]|uniref:flavin prenyltransferase n=1 Tax=mine drainage metagenome TaxID=410659 RepID=A0A1J5Q6B8_9ZZZZ
MNSTLPYPARPRLIVALTGATGIVYGVRLLQHLRRLGTVETHLLISPAGVLNLKVEWGLDRQSVEALADVTHPTGDIGASIASGSFATVGMVVAPCSMRSLAAIAHGLCDNLITRAADVCLKERRRLVLLPREAPLHLAHLRNMTTVTEMGGVIFPPLPAFYLRPSSIETMVDGSLARVLDLLGVVHDLGQEWQGIDLPALRPPTSG